jgi:hypothetical protein
MRLKKLQEKVKEHQEKVGEKVCSILCLNIDVFHQLPFFCFICILCRNIVVFYHLPLFCFAYILCLNIVVFHLLFSVLLTSII